ncbi:MAG: propanediol utilization protein [Nitrososphaerota archaeon]
MSDRISQFLSEYIAGTSYTDLSPEVVREVKRRVLDSLGCALAALQEPAPSLARRAAARYAGIKAGASLFGTLETVPIEWAAFANGVAVRYLDFNDTYLSREPLHPSDLIPAALAACEAAGKGGKELIAAIATGYEVAMRLCDATSLRKMGWDHVNFLGLGALAAVARLLDLSQEQISNAISIYIVPHASMRQTRVGELSMWKGAAAANSSRNAVFACLLAKEGFTGPFQPFEGEMAFIKLVAKYFDYSALEGMGKRPPSKILESYMKFYPVEYHAQTAVDGALQLWKRGLRPDRIERIDIETFDAAYEIIVKDPEKWAPKTRETADHSLPYCVAVCLAKGDIWIGDFNERMFKDETVNELLRKMKVTESREFSSLYPKAFPTHIKVRTKENAVLEIRVDHAPGHPQRPVEDQRVLEKFNRLAMPVIGKEGAERLAGLVFNLEGVSNISKVIGLLDVRGKVASA